MTKIKKLTAILLSAVMFVCCFAVQASAESIENKATTISSGKSYSTTIYNLNDEADFKITTNKSGILKINFTSKMNNTRVLVYDSDGNIVRLSEKSVSSGRASDYSDSYGFTECWWNETVEKFSGTLSYSVKKGTYYISFFRYSLNNRWYTEGTGKISFTATFPSSSSSSSSSKISCITIPMWVGDTLQLSTDAGNSGVTWSSSKSSVATVSSAGKVTAKKAGTTVITAKSESGTAKIQIKVTK